MYTQEGVHPSYRELIQKLYAHLSPLKGREVDLRELSKRLGVGKTLLLELGEELHQFYPDEWVLLNRRKKKVMLTAYGRRVEGYVPLEERMKVFKIGFACESWIGHKDFSLTTLWAAYKVFEREDVNLTLFVGDLFAGKETMSKEGEIIMKTPEEQVSYAVATFPKLESGVKTHVVPADQDVYRFPGGKGSLNMVEKLAEKRRDIVMEVGPPYEFPIYATDIVVYALNPVSRRERSLVGKTNDLQYIMESITLKELSPEKKYVLALGGFHTFSLLPSYGDVMLGIQLPSLVKEAPSLTKKRITSSVGVVVVEFHLSGKDSETGKRELRHVNTKFYSLRRYWKPGDFVAPPELDGLSERERRVLQLIHKEREKGASVGKLSRETKLDKETVEKICKKLESMGRVVYRKAPDKYFSNLRFKTSLDEPPELEDRTQTFKFLVIGDTHINSYSQQINLVRELYRVAEREDVDAILHAGDFADGPGAVGYKGHQFESFFQDPKTLFEYIRENYPTARGRGGRVIKTYFIEGNHDKWVKKEIGNTFVEELLTGREDLVYLPSHCVSFSKDGAEVKVALHHPSSAYSPKILGYTIMKVISTNLHRKEVKDALLNVIGHHHKAAVLVVGDRIGILPGCLKAPDEFTVEKNIPEWVGGWIVEVGLREGGGVNFLSFRYVDMKDKIREDDWTEMPRWLMKKSKDGRNLETTTEVKLESETAPRGTRRRPCGRGIGLKKPTYQQTLDGFLG